MARKECEVRALRDEMEAETRREIQRYEGEARREKEALLREVDERGAELARL